MRIKRSVFYVIVAVIVTALALGAFFFLTQTSVSEPGTEKKGGFGTLFPFNFGNGGGQQNNVNEPPLIAEEKPIPQLRLISSTPTTAGFLYENPSGTTTLRFIERSTGHVFETTVENLTTTRISNTTIPGIQSVVWENENGFIIRYLEDGVVQNFYAELLEDEVDQPLGGVFVSRWDRGVGDPQKENLFTITKTTNGSVGILSGFDGSNERVVFTSAISSWVPLQSSNDLYVQTAPISGESGFLYKIRGGSLIRVLGDIPGLQSVISPSGKYILYSSVEKNNATLSLLNTETGEVFASPLNTVARKCVFVSEKPAQAVCGIPETIPAGSHPNDWLLGKVRFSDDIWLLELEEATARLLAIPTEDVNTDVDVWQPTASADGSYVGFINKNNLSYWLLRVEETIEGDT